LLNFLLVYTGFGLFMGAVTLGVFGLECYWRLRRVSHVPVWASLAGLSVAGASLGSFFLQYRREPAADCFVFPDPNLSEYPRFMALIAARFSGMALPVRVADVTGSIAIICGAAVLSLIAIEVVKGKRLGMVQLIEGVLLVYTSLFMVSTAVGRVCLGFTAAETTRYATFLIPGILGGYFFLQSILMGGVRRALTMTLILCALPGLLMVDEGADWFADGKRAWAECYVRTEDIGRCDRTTGFAVHPHPERTGMKEKLDYLKAHRLNLFSDTSRTSAEQAAAARSAQAGESACPTCGQQDGGPEGKR
jgi:hypothetical protein